MYTCLFSVNSEANARRITMVENCFGSSGLVRKHNPSKHTHRFDNLHSFQPLAIPGRVLVGEGVLTKMCRKRPKARQFFLFNDILVYGNIVIGKKKYNKQHIIPLEEVQLQGLEDNGRKRSNCKVFLVDLFSYFVLFDLEYKNGWLIRTTTKSFAVYAATHTEKQEWMAHINKCIEDLLRKSEFLFRKTFLRHVTKNVNKS